MTRESDSVLNSLFNTEGSLDTLTASERRLLKFAVDNFGEPLSRILLAGLWEDGVEQRWQFNITFTDTGAATYECRLQVITYELIEGESYLPRRRDPLVLLALLHFLLGETGEPKTELTFEPRDVLTGLGWRNTDEARREVDEVMERYSALTYMWILSGGESTQKGWVKGRERLFSNYRTIDEEGQNGGRQEFRHIVFNTAFIDALRRRTLFGVDWGRVTSIKAIRG